MRSSHDVAGMNCPVCRTSLALADRQGIEIDYCPQCRGVWLDRGELDKIIERGSAQITATPVAAAQPAYPPQQHGHGYKGHKRQKHWLENIFD